MIRMGKNIRINTVPIVTPYARLMAIGIRNCACILLARIMGKSPTVVVMDVRIMGLNLIFPD